MRFLRGQATIALSLAIPMMVGAVCIGTDMRALYLSSSRLQQAADAAVLSGAEYLPANPTLAQSVARSQAQTNGIRENEIVYNRSASDSRSITMVVERNVPYRFARLFGLSQSLITIKAVAATNSSQSATGLLPIGIQYDAHYTGHRAIVLKLASARSAALAGTWRPLAMGACGGCDSHQSYQWNLFHGYESPVSMGEMVSVEVSEIAESTQSGLAARIYSGLRRDPDATPTNYTTGDPRRIEVPIVDFNSDHANSNDLTGSVQGFAMLWISSIDTKGNIGAEFLDFIFDKDNADGSGRGALTPVLLQ